MSIQHILLTNVAPVMPHFSAGPFQDRRENSSRESHSSSSIATSASMSREHHRGGRLIISID
jgi:hypothetical protein